MYKFITSDSRSVVHIPTSRCIYLDQPETIHTEAYLKWVADGGVTEAYVPPVVVPLTPEQVRAAIAPVSPRQIRQALTRAGLRASVEAAVAAGDQDLKDWWDFSTTFERLNPQVTAMGAALGVSDTQLDDLWTLASTL